MDHQYISITGSSSTNRIVSLRAIGSTASRQPNYGMSRASSLASHPSAIHPVAGGMPGHMNVLLADAGVENDMLVEMKELKPHFPSTDLVIGACDVVNPAAMASAGTPISGMPILLAQDTRHIIVCNYDESPRYSGVANPLYENSKTIKLFGDAGQTMTSLINFLKNCSSWKPAIKASRP